MTSEIRRGHTGWPVDVAVDRSARRKTRREVGDKRRSQWRVRVRRRIRVKVGLEKFDGAAPKDGKQSGGEVKGASASVSGLPE